MPLADTLSGRRRRELPLDNFAKKGGSEMIEEELRGFRCQSDVGL